MIWQLFFLLRRWIKVFVAVAVAVVVVFTFAVVIAVADADVTLVATINQILISHVGPFNF